MKKCKSGQTMNDRTCSLLDFDFLPRLCTLVVAGRPSSSSPACPPVSVPGLLARHVRVLLTKTKSTPLVLGSGPVLLLLRLHLNQSLLVPLILLGPLRQLLASVASMTLPLLLPLQHVHALLLVAPLPGAVVPAPAPAPEQVVSGGSAPVLPVASAAAQPLHY